MTFAPITIFSICSLEAKDPIQNISNYYFSITSKTRKTILLINDFDIACIYLDVINCDIQSSYLLIFSYFVASKRTEAVIVAKAL